jgi:UDP-sugar pyrophosphorylase
MVDKLLGCGQDHLFEHWPAPGEGDDDKRRFLAQAATCDAGYPGGVAKYVSNAKKLLSDSKLGVNPFDGWTPSVPDGVVVEYASEKHRSLEELGMREIGSAAFVLVAGGLGERLGYSGIKVELPCERATDACYLQLYVHSILALQSRAVGEMPAHRSAKDAGIPLAIMTSDDTHQKTLDLLERNDYFGAKPSQVTLIKQEKVPCLTDNDARLALAADDPYKLQTKPHGHGDVHALLHTSGLLDRWSKAGKKWVVFFQDTNSLVFRVVPGALGVSAEKGFVFNSLCVPRKAKEAIGAIADLTHVDGRKMTVNVEYNQLDPLLRATINADGDVNDESTGLSPFPGNINQLIVSLPEYKAQLAKTGGQIEEFVNPKYKDETKTAFKSPTRLECMMQDYPKSLDKDACVGFTVFDNWVGYSPVKNSPADGVAKFKGGNPTHTATSGEMEYYGCAAKLLELAGAHVASPSDFEANGIVVPAGPRVVAHPSFACTFAELDGKVGKVALAPASTLVVEGAGVTLESLVLDGALVIKACAGANVTVKGLTVKNKGWRWVACGEDAGEVDKLRGFVVEKDETETIVFDAPGNYVVPSE